MTALTGLALEATDIVSLHTWLLLHHPSYVSLLRLKTSRYMTCQYFNSHIHVYHLSLFIYIIPRIKLSCLHFTYCLLSTCNVHHIFFSFSFFQLCFNFQLLFDFQLPFYYFVSLFLISNGDQCASSYDVTLRGWNDFECIVKSK